MVAVVAGILWGSYSLAYWGWTRVQGCPASFADLVVPGRYQGCNQAAKAPSVDDQFAPTPGTGLTGKGVGGGQGSTPPSTLGYMSRTRK